MTIVLNDDDVAQVLTMKDCISVLEDAYREIALGGTVNPPRRDSLMMVGSRPDAYYSFKIIEGGLERLGVFAQRVNSDMITYPVVDGVARRVKVPNAPGNRYVGLVYLYSSETLELLAILNDGHVQRMRVAGTTGVGAKHLAPENARTAALLGSGWQAETAAWAIAEVRPLKTMRVFSPNRVNREALAKKLASTLKIDVVPVESTQKAVQGAEIVACATNSHGPEPVVSGNLIEPGMHITSILPSDFDEEAWQKSEFIIFSAPGGPAGHPTFTTGNPRTASIRSDANLAGWEQERFERFKDKIFMLPDLLIGKTPKRSSAKQITMMNKNWGLGIEFASVSKLIYDKARAAGIGKEIPTEWFSQTSHP